MCINIYIYVYLYIYICLFIHIYIYIFIYTFFGKRRCWLCQRIYVEPRDCRSYQHCIFERMKAHKWKLDVWASQIIEDSKLCERFIIPNGLPEKVSRTKGKKVKTRNMSFSTVLNTSTKWIDPMYFTFPRPGQQRKSARTSLRNVVEIGSFPHISTEARGGKNRPRLSASWLPQLPLCEVAFE